MKFAYMSFTCPEGTLTDLIELARKHGYDGIEPRAMAGHRHGVELDASPDRRKEIRRVFQESGIECACIATPIRYCQPDPKAYRENIELTGRFLELSADVGCNRLRVFGGSPGVPLDPQEGIRIVGSALSELAEKAERHNVILCLETHDFFSRADMVSRAVRMADSPCVRANWDIMHPFTRNMSIPEAFDHLRDIVAHCHVHDCVYDEKRSPKLALMGEGDIPYREALRLLKEMDYSGFLSGEYIAAWKPDIVLPHDIRVLKSYLT